MRIPYLFRTDYARWGRRGAGSPWCLEMCWEMSHQEDQKEKWNCIRFNFARGKTHPGYDWLISTRSTTHPDKELNLSETAYRFDFDSERAWRWGEREVMVQTGPLRSSGNSRWRLERIMRHIQSSPSFVRLVTKEDMPYQLRKYIW